MISIIATANPSLNDIKLDTKIIITNTNMLACDNRSNANDISSISSQIGVISL